MTLRDVVDRWAPPLEPLEKLYKDIHANPELSRLEERTASVVASRLREIRYDVHEAIGGHGVVGVLENGPGKVVLLRAELDALPIREQTNISYASTKRMADWWGRDQPVMHACGHDLHMTCLLAAAELLEAARSEWAGTLLVLFQPNEEHTGGAQAMVDDGLYDKVPRPDIVMAQHLMQIPSGAVSIKPGPVLVSADTVNIRIFSSEGHPANPQVSVDVAVVASKIIARLENLVHETAKAGYASATVEELHLGQPGLDWVQHADIVLDVKAYDPSIRSRLLDGVTEIVREVFWAAFGAQSVLDDVPSHPCEDFSILATAINVPYVFWFLGRADAEALDRAKKAGRLLDDIPIEHSPFNAPLIHPTLETVLRKLELAPDALSNRGTVDIDIIIVPDYELTSTGFQRFNYTGIHHRGAESIWQSMIDSGDKLVQSLVKTLVYPSSGRVRPLIFIAYGFGGIVVKRKIKDHPEIRKMCLAQRNVVLFGVPHLDQERRDLWPKLDILLKSYGYPKGFYKDQNEDHTLIVDVSYKFKNLDLTGRVLSVYKSRPTRIRSIPHKEELLVGDMAVSGCCPDKRHAWGSQQTMAGHPLYKELATLIEDCASDSIGAMDTGVPSDGK
ncbi:uncharacterized protein E0L32_007772 [Thyridium curvatum]|uniref:Uncharacterized protein n=1 Tax=Thyridium curvatum TaxID=1093900 RepID=A0A507B3C4_9PEZI|nr:uncharacterized protein E0L32_007772 [Thyridium curvatum]TPX11561.1 hypothetical protein E0L32_007772 [Thyridium curvatum]